MLDNNLDGDVLEIRCR